MKKQKGFIALVSILIIEAIILAITIGISLRSIDESKMSLNVDLSNESQSLSEACAEYALVNLRENLNYSGSETVNIDQGECEILAVEGSGNNDRIIKVQSSASGYGKKIIIEISAVKPVMEIYSWKNVTDFN